MTITCGAYKWIYAKLVQNVTIGLLNIPAKQESCRSMHSGFMRKKNSSAIILGGCNFMSGHLRTWSAY